MRKVSLAIVLCSFVVLSFVSNYHESEAQGVIDVDESNYRTPIVGGSLVNNIYEITRFNCPDPTTGEQHHPFGNQAGHMLIDINIIGANDNDTGTPIYSSGNGEVKLADENQGLVQIENAEMGNYYGHMAKLYVSSGQTVTKGQLIGLMGNKGVSLGAHLHWETYPMPGYSFDPTQIEGVEETLPGGGCTSNPVDGYIWGSSLSGYASCSEFAAQGFQEVYLFDHADCQGESIALDGLASGPIVYNLNLSTNFNDKARSIYIPNNWAVTVGANVDDDPYLLGRCLINTESNLDNLTYSNPAPGGGTVKIGFDQAHQNGWDMISYVVVNRTLACPFTSAAVAAYYSGVMPSITTSFVEATVGSYAYEGGIVPSYSPWLLEFSKYNNSPFDVDIHTKVGTSSGDYSAHRVLVDGQNIGETSTNEQFITWNTYGWADGDHTLTVQYRRSSDNGNWSTALSYEEQFYLSPNRSGVAPCGTQADGVTLTSGNDCILVTQDYGDLAPIGWSDRNNVQACVVGQNSDLVAWLYDGVLEHGNFQGVPNVLSYGQCAGVGGNISSVDLRTAQEVLPDPNAPFTADANTIALYHFDEGSGPTLNDSVDSLTGAIYSGSWDNGRFGTALKFVNPTDGRGVLFSPVDVCSFTAEMWLREDASGNWRVAGQMQSGGNSGQNKWLISLDNLRPKFEVWSGGGSQSATSFKQLQLGQWQYVMASYDCNSGQAKLYLDQELVAEFTSIATINSGATTFEIGSAEGIYKCNCAVDEFRLSNVARVPTVQVAPTAVVVFYTDANNQGTPLAFYGTSAVNLSPELSNVFNAVSVLPGWSTLIYEDTQGAGGATCLVADDPDLSNNSFDNGHVVANNIESLRVLDDSNCGGWIPTVYPTETFTPVPTATDVPANQGSNLIANGSFESLDTNGNPLSWSNDASSNITVDQSSNGDDGTNSLHFTGAGSDIHAFAAAVEIQPNVDYTISQYVKTSAGSGEFGFYIDAYDANWNWLSDGSMWLGAIQDSQSASSDSYSYEYFTANSNVAYIAIQYYMVAGTGFDTYVDSVAVYPSVVPTATPIPASPTPSVTNLVTNGGFENLDGNSWANNWMADRSSVSIDTTSQGNEGANTLYFTPDNANSHAFSDKFAVSSANYEWSFYVLATSGSGEFGFYIDEYDSSQNWISGQWIDAVYGATNEVKTYTYVPSSGSVSYASLQYYMVANTTFSAFVDSVLVYQLGMAMPTPTVTQSPTQQVDVLLSQGKSMSASNQKNGYGAELVNDGSIDTYWESENGFPASITMDLGQMYYVGKVVMKVNWGGRIENVEILTSDDNVTYVTAVAGADYNLGTEEVVVNSEARYVKLVVWSNSDAPAAQMAEVEVWGTDLSQPVPTSVPTIAPTLTSTPLPTATYTPSPTETMVPTNTAIPQTNEVELLSSPWVLSRSSSGSEEVYQEIDPYSLQGRDTLRVTLNLHGASFGCGDESALIFDQNGWQVLCLASHAQNGYDGLQTFEIPLSDFYKLDSSPAFDPSQTVGTMHVRLWKDSGFTVEINSIVAFDSPNY